MKRFSWLLVGILIVAATIPVMASPDGDKVKQGLSLMESGDFEGALAKFRDAQIDHPTATELHFNIGMALYKLERFEEARGAFENAIFSRNKEIEKKALFHTANCFVKEGKWEQALDYLNRAIQLDENYQAAKINREYVVRKMKEMARKKKEQQKKKKEEQKIIEKVQELLKEQVGVHGAFRMGMAVRGEDVPKTRIKEFAQFLDQTPPADQVDEVKNMPEEKFFSELASSQEKLLVTLRAITAEVTKKLEDAEAAKKGGGQPDPESAKLTKALPHLQDAEPNMTRGVEAARDEFNFSGTHAAQEQAVFNLMAALNELMDELARLIKEEALLLGDSYGVHQAMNANKEDDKPTAEEQQAQALSQKVVQEKLRERTEKYAQGLERHLDGLKKQLKEKTQPNGQGVQPGEDPNEGIRKVESALTHLNSGSGFMEEAEVALEAPSFEEAVGKEKSALEELIKARAALSPPQQQQGGGDKEQKGDKKEEKQEGDGEKKDDKKQDQTEEGQQAKPSESEKENEKDKKKGEARELTEEQAKKTLEQQKQREMDRRREQKDKMKKARRGKSRGVKKDW